MRPSLRGRFLLLASIGICAATITGGVYTEALLQEPLHQSFSDALNAKTRLAKLHLHQALGPKEDDVVPLKGLQDKVESLSQVLNLRVTVFSERGDVLADSWEQAGQAPPLDSISDRPEFVDALKTGSGSLRRFSITMRDDVFMAASLLQLSATDRGVLRLAASTKKLEASLTRVRIYIWLSGFLALATALAYVFFLSRHLNRNIRRFIEYARDIAIGRKPGRLGAEAPGEFGALASNINRLASDFEEVVEKLSLERDRFRGVLEGMEEGVLAIDSSGHISAVNSAALSILGVFESPIGKTPMETIRLPVLHELIEKVKEDDTIVAEFELGENKQRQILARAAWEGSGVGTVIVFHDVTQLRQLERMRRDFIANVSHELRTPVSIILASAETLESGIIENPNKHVVRFLEAIHRNADRMGRLINDLLDISRIESGRYELELSNVDLRSLIERVLRGVETKLTEHETELHFEILDPLEVQGDPKALDQIFVNLIHNATKYTPKGSTLRVYATSSSRPNRVRICVEDNGPGIPDKYRPRLFERFYRVDKGRSRDAGGTGLGLAIVKHLVQAMNGDVGCDAALPHGSIFWVELPQKSGSAIE